MHVCTCYVCPGCCPLAYPSTPPIGGVTVVRYVKNAQYTYYTAALNNSTETQVYLPMGYCYAHRIRAEPTKVITELREVKLTL